MARTIQDIQQEIIRTKEAEPALAELNSTSKTAVWRLWTYITAVAIWSLEKLMDIHTADVDYKLSQLKPHTARWYRNKALAFQYGFDLLEDSDRFNNAGKSSEEIENSKIIKYSAVTEDENQTRLIIKIAGEKDGKLAQLAPEVETAFRAYMAEIKDAGVPITVINYLPDELKLHIRIVRDALVLDAGGMDILTAKRPVDEAIQQFMKELPFDGELSLQKLTDKIQAVPGVRDVSLDLAQSRWIDGTAGSYGNWQSVDISTVPVSGYFAVDFEGENKSEVTYI
ncbi:MAG: nucleotidyltransferase [Capnocytophaga sp.]|nr:nucleotidyltransferase [Capnocytophaga sp.]